MSTLYRKYRPGNFSETVGQNYIKIILEHQISTDHLAHAYLFCGPRAVGKTTLARVLAKAVNCLNRQSGDAEPCGKCEACLEITEGRSLDVAEIDAASHTGVDNVREHIIASARVAPSSLKYKVFIIDEVHMLSTQAFNALLKTLEEPPKNVLFVLCTTEIHKVPQTIISRCQRFDFKRISLNDVVKKLQHIVSKENVKVDKKILEAVARQADGHLRDAESLLGQLVNVGGKEITEEEAGLVIPRSDLAEVLRLLNCLSEKDASTAIRLLNKLVDEGIDLRVFTNDLIEVLRKMLLLKINPSLLEYLSLEMGESMELELNRVKEKFSVEQLVYLIEQFVKAQTEIKHSFIVQLPLEIVVAKVCHSAASQAASVRQPAARPAVTEEPGVKPESVAAKSVASNVTVAEIINNWQNFLLKIREYNHSLSFILKVCQPRTLNGSSLCVAFKYKFHKDRVNDPNIKNLIERVLNEVYGEQLTLEAVIDEDLDIDSIGSASAGNEGIQPPAPDSEPVKAGDGNEVIDTLLKTFGGKIVG